MKLRKFVASSLALSAIAVVLVAPVHGQNRVSVSGASQPGTRPAIAPTTLCAKCDPATGNLGVGTMNPTADLTISGNLSRELAGTVSTVMDNPLVIGAGTDFDGELMAGDAVQIGAEVLVVCEVVDDTNLVVDPAPTVSLGGVPAFTDSDLLLVQNGVGAGEVVVDKSGRVGIGTTTPSMRLELVDDTDDVGLVRMVNFNQGTSAGAALLASAFGNNVFMRAYGDNHGSLAGLVEIGTSAGTTDVALLAGSEQVRIQSDGDVGIGTTSPARKLDVRGDVIVGNGAGDEATINLLGASGSIRAFLETAGTTMIVDSDSDIRFRPGNTERMVMTSTGRLGIGTASPLRTLHVFGNFLIDAAGGAPAAVSGAAQLWENSGELFVRDGGGIDTQLSPHNPETQEWWFNSKNTEAGTTITIEMERMMKELDRLLGGGFVTENGTTTSYGSSVAATIRRLESENEVLQERLAGLERKLAEAGE